MKRPTDLLTTTLLFGLLGLTWALPQGLVTVLGTATTTVAQGQREVIKLADGGGIPKLPEDENAPPPQQKEKVKKQLELSAPEGWQRAARTSSSRVTYLQGKKMVEVSVTEKVGDLDAAMKRHIRRSGLAGNLIQLDGPKVTTAAGFTGRHCTYTRADSSRRGDCAMVSRDGTLVVVVSSNEPGKDPLDLNGIVASIDIKDSAK